MARYISRAGAFKKGVVKSIVRNVTDKYGAVSQVEEGKPIIAIFKRGGATPREAQIALERFTIKGLADGENPVRRLSIYDTDEEAREQGWDDELKAQVEEALNKGQNQDYFRIEADKAPKPWPSYDETPEESIVDIANVVGVSLEDVLVYEKENQNRESVVIDVKKALSSLADDSEVVVQA